MTIRHIWAVYKKQNKDTLKNKSVFLPFLIFPIMAFIMEYAVTIEGMPENYFLMLFAIMFLGMAPLTSMAALIAEEKEKYTLRVLKMAGVTSGEYMLGAGSCLFLFCLLGAVAFGIIGAFSGWDLVCFLLIMAVGIVLSLCLGAVIGMWSKNQTAATAVTTPVMMIFSFLPMISMFNEQVGKVARFTYTQQIHQLLMQFPQQRISGEMVAVIAGNLLVVVGLCGAAYKRRGL